jgi:formylglycine-generating enzyme
VAALAGCASPPNGHVLVAVPAGTYRVGAEGHEWNPLRRVTVAAFEIAATETTNAQFARFVEATGFVTDAERAGFGMVFEEGMIDWQWRRTPGACWRRPFGDERFAAATHPDNPVTQISAADAAAYCAWAGTRLPTVEEWEIAARAGAETRYPWGDELAPGGKAMANIWTGTSHLRSDDLDGFTYLAPVASFPPNRWGLFDVCGNVFEYCAGGVESKNPADATHLTTARGGSWWCSANTCSAYNLVDIGQMDRNGSFANQGFRVAK